MPAEVDSYPFEEGEGSTITEERWKEMFKWMRTNGVLTREYELPDGADLYVSPDSGMSVQIETGEAIIEGAKWKHTGDPFSLSIPENLSGEDRIDLVVLRCDFAQDTMYYALVQGEPGTPPIEPLPEEGEVVFEIPLASVYVEVATEEIDASDITDKRIKSIQSGGGSTPATSPICYVYRDTTTDNLTNNSTTTIDFDTSKINPYEMWESVTNPERITISESGIYYMHAEVGFGGVGLANGCIEIQIVLNSTETLVRNRIIIVGDEEVYLNAQMYYELYEGDYIHLNAINDCGQTIDLLTNPSLQVVKIREQVGGGE